MLAAAQASGRLLAVVAQNRFTDADDEAASGCSDPVCSARVLHAQVDSFWWRGSNYYDLWWRGTWDKEGGGCTMNHAVHHIDLFQWMMGLPVEVLAVTANLAHDNSEVEDFSTAVLTYAGRAHRADHRLAGASWRGAAIGVPGRARRRSPCRGRSRRCGRRKTDFRRTDAASQADLRPSTTQLPAVRHEGHDGQIANFLDAIEGREPLLVDGDQGRRTLELITRHLSVWRICGQGDTAAAGRRIRSTRARASSATPGISTRRPAASRTSPTTKSPWADNSAGNREG